MKVKENLTGSWCLSTISDQSMAADLSMQTQGQSLGSKTKKKKEKNGHQYHDKFHR